MAEKAKEFVAVTSDITVSRKVRRSIIKNPLQVSDG
jgi:hypothetical protein